MDVSSLSVSNSVAPTTTAERRLPVGAEIQPAGGVHVRVWCPERRRVEVVLQQAGSHANNGSTTEECHALEAEANGYFAGLIAASAGDRYGFRLNDDPKVYPDPASRFQPDGPHGLSEIIDPDDFTWTDGDWRGPSQEGQVLYEMHIGTFTADGTWNSATDRLPFLADVGVTTLQVMPVADFPGRYGWGYDGVNLFAATRLYGRPNDFRRFVDCAHQAGLAVILDVVYNHLGPDGNYLPQFSPDYFSRTHSTDWGQSINFDGENCGPVREFYLANAAYWISEFHLDGLRLDATQDIHDSSEPHILAEIAETVQRAAAGRGTYLVAENEPQDVRLVTVPEQDGFGLDSLYNEDFHHTAMVRLTGHSEAYYTDYRGSPQEFVSAAKHGPLYQGQWYRWQKKRRGSCALGMRSSAFVNFIQNHDQVANTSRGLRCHTVSSAGCYRAMTAFLLLGPGTPMLFQGQEFASSSPFFYFADHREELARAVEEGRRQFMSQFRSLSLPSVQEKLPNPADPQSFVRSKLNWGELESRQEIVALHRDLLRLRLADPVYSRQQNRAVDGAVLSDDAFLLRDFAADRDRLLIVNFGPDLHFDPAPEPLLAPLAGMQLGILWSSEDFAYGGSGTPPLESEENWQIPGQTAVVLHPAAGDEG